MNKIVGTFLGSLVLMLSLPSGAATLSVNPVSQTVNAGSSFNVDLVVSGLGDQLDIALLGSFTITTPYAADRVNLFQLSFDTIDDLDNFQPDTFTLATLSFKALMAGNSPFSLTLNSASDASGNELVLDTQGGNVEVVGVAAVPLPSAWLLFATGTLFLRQFKRKGELYDAAE